MDELRLSHRIIETIKRFHRDGQPIYAYNVGMVAGYDPSIVSRWFRDRGIFWDHWRGEWVCIVPELAGEILETGAIRRAEWLSSGWLRRGYAPTPKAGEVVR